LLRAASTPTVQMTWYRPELDSIDPDGQDLHSGQVALGQYLEEPLARLDGLAGDLALGHSNRLSHLREDVLVPPGEDAGDQDLEHPIGERSVLAHRLVGGDVALARLARPGGLLPQPGLGDAEPALPEGDAASLGAVVGDVAVGLLALLLGAGQLDGAHQENGLDGGPSHDVDEVVDGDLGVLDEVEHRHEELAVLGEDLGEALVIERRRTVRKGDDLVALSHRCWLQCKGLSTTR
jgi:hypothetical protein